jgi:sigma-54 specific flagellar transcriptional regulator A
LASTHIHFRGAAFFIGISEEIFEQLWQRAPESSKAGSLHPHGVNTNTSDDFRGFVDQHPGWEAPDSIRNAYMGGSPAAEQVRRLIMLAARVDHSVLVEGKTGTGKEVVARQIHELSQRRVQRFVTVNCGGIPADLLESELFGHKKGAFTGALTDKDGLWTIASTGTLFLDEIGDLSRQHQVKILRALEDGKYRSVGGTEEIKSKARIVAATNRDLAKMVAAGQFREDLYYRLFTFRIRTPALRDHPDDIPEMAAHFWQEIARNECGRLPENVMDALKGYRWPGNARELRAFLINVFMLADSRPVTLPLIHAVMHERIGPIPHPNPEP